MQNDGLIRKCKACKNPLYSLEDIVRAENGDVYDAQHGPGLCEYCGLVPVVGLVRHCINCEPQAEMREAALAAAEAERALAVEAARLARIQAVLDAIDNNEIDSGKFFICRACWLIRDRVEDVSRIIDSRQAPHFYGRSNLFGPLCDGCYGMRRRPDAIPAEYMT